jgi:hypothetical protein
MVKVRLVYANTQEAAFNEWDFSSSARHLNSRKATRKELCCRYVTNLGDAELTRNSLPWTLMKGTGILRNDVELRLMKTILNSPLSIVLCHQSLVLPWFVEVLVVLVNVYKAFDCS